MQEAIDQLVQGHDSLQNSLEDLENQKRDAADKLRRKKAELERMEQRLMQLKNVRAPYQDELDALELELSGLYGVYMTKFRSLEYLEFQLSKIRRCDALYNPSLSSYFSDVIQQLYGNPFPFKLIKDKAVAI